MLKYIEHYRDVPVLSLDFEARPTAWIAGDFVGKSTTAVGWVWRHEGTAHSVVLNRKMTSVAPIVDAINEQIFKYDEVLLVGHYLRGYDLPVLNADRERLGYDSLPKLLTHDTKLDRKQGIGLSESLENLVTRYELEHEKMPMHEPWWEEHNLLQTPRSVKWVKERVERDVLATLDLYEVMLGRMKAPKVWDPNGSKMPRYRG